MRVYALVDPTTGRIRYVGQTDKTLDWRLARHISCTKSGAQAPVNRWIVDLLLKKQRPTILLLEETDALTAEEDWIDVMVLRNVPILNCHHATLYTPLDSQPSNR